MTDMDRHKTNDCVMNSERGALVRGSDPPSGHNCVHNTACDTWQAPARRLIQKHLSMVCRKQATKIRDPSPMAKTDLFFRFWEKSVGRRGQPLASLPMDPSDIFEAVVCTHWPCLTCTCMHAWLVMSVVHSRRSRSYICNQGKLVGKS